MNIEIENFQQIVDLLDKYPDIAEVLFDKAIKNSILSIQRDAIIKAPVNTGALRSSIQSGFEPLVGVLEVLSPYGAVMEYGTQPHFPPLDEIKKWCLLKFGTDAPAFAIAKKIAREGTKARPYLGPAIEKNEQKVQDYFEKALQDALNQITIKV